jgi:uncharacterized protein (DUF1330 family)
MAEAYVIGHITVKNAEKWSEYRRSVPATIEPWDGVLVFRGRMTSVLSGSHKHNDTVVIKFPDKEAVNGWYSSPEYRALIPLRKEAAEIELIVFEE